MTVNVWIGKKIPLCSLVEERRKILDGNNCKVMGCFFFFFEQQIKERKNICPFQITRSIENCILSDTCVISLLKFRY